VRAADEKALYLIFDVACYAGFANCRADPDPGSCCRSVWDNSRVPRETATGQQQTFKPLAKYTVEKIAFKSFGASVQPMKKEIHEA
jgi:hypothetical protein